MEFRFRAADAKNISPAAPPPDVSRADSGRGELGASRALGVAAGGDQQLRAAMAAEELQRLVVQERMLRREAERRALEAEVRQDLAMELLRRGGSRAESSLPPLLGALGLRCGVVPGSQWTATGEGLPPPSRSPFWSERGNVEAAAAPAGEPGTPCVQSLRPDEVAPPLQTASGSKRKQPGDAIPAMPGTRGGKEQQPEQCFVVAREKGLVEHPNANSHKKEVLFDAATSGKLSAGAAVDSDKPSKLFIETCDGTIHHVLQMDGYLLCELCNVHATCRATMMGHLQGGKHTSKAKSLRDDEATTGIKEECAVPVAVTVDCTEETVAMEVDGVTHAVLRMHGCLRCKPCNVQANNEYMMRGHLRGKKHTSKTMAAADVSIVQAKKEVAMSKEGTTEMINSTEPTTVQAEVDASIRIKSAQRKGKLAVALAEVTAASTNAAMSESDVPATTTMQIQEEAAVPLASTQARSADVASTTGSDIVARTVKIQVEGTMYVVQEQENGELFCAPCGVRCHNTLGMQLHLYTAMHGQKDQVEEWKQLAAP